MVSNRSTHAAACSNYPTPKKTQTLEAYGLADAKWRPLGIFHNNDMVTAAPFDAIVIRLADLWG